MEPPPTAHRRIDHPHSHPGKRISIRSRRFVPRAPERWADVKAGFVHRGAHRACRPRTQRGSGWAVEEVVVVGDLRGQVSAAWEERRRSCGTGLWDRMRQPQMPQEPRNHHRVFDQRNQRQASTTPRTGEDIQPEAAVHQIRPVLVAPIGSVRRTEVLILGVVGSRVLVGTDRCAELDYEGPPRH